MHKRVVDETVSKCFCLQIVECSVLFAAQTTYVTGSYAISVAAADLNGDNKPDIIVANYKVRTPLVFFSTQATAPLRIKRPMQLAVTHNL